MSRTRGRVYLGAFVVQLVAWVAVLTSSEIPGTALGVAAVCLFTSNTVIFLIARRRVQRGDAWRDTAGTFLPIMGEFVLMQFGLRLPAAVTSLRSV